MAIWRKNGFQVVLALKRLATLRCTGRSRVKPYQDMVGGDGFPSALNEVASGTGANNYGPSGLRMVHTYISNLRVTYKLIPAQWARLPWLELLLI